MNFNEYVNKYVVWFVILHSTLKRESVCSVNETPMFSAKKCPILFKLFSLLTPGKARSQGTKGREIYET